MATASTDDNFNVGSPFLDAGPTSRTASLAILHLRRDSLLPTVLETVDANNEGYAEGKVTNTRFGSFPHSTLIGLPWGSQIAASIVDTGSRGRKGAGHGKKRKLGEMNEEASLTSTPISAADMLETQPQHPPKTPVAAASGFCHLLPPTPESWTLSLPHRTQVVYTPDYSYILQQLRVQPGSIVIEAGAGSGSFTHAAARAVFSGYSSAEANPAKPTPYGRVYSFEYHEPRAKQLQVELEEHGLASLVHLTHRDVYKDGFLLPPDPTNPSTPTSPNATHIFLDLPQPWHALPHLTRIAPSPLNPTQTAHIALFLPCIEQVSRAASALRSHGWTELRVLELAQRRLDVRRERVGLAFEGLRGVNATPRDVGEALGRLREVEARWIARARRQRGEAEGGMDVDEEEVKEVRKGETLGGYGASGRGRGLCDGRVVVRTEPEVRTHTSYLVFAVLPVVWSEEEERMCRERWPVKVVEGAEVDDGKAKRKAKVKGKKG